MVTLEPTLNVRFLGCFAYRAGGAWQTGPGFKHGREFLEYMTAYPRGPATYQRLEEAFWPGLESDALRHRLHVAAAGARAALRCVFPSFDSIRVLPGAYAWNPKLRIESDYNQLLRCCDEGNLDAMKRGVALYDGDFCAGESADWIHVLRARASSAYVTMLQTLAEDAFQRGDCATAVRYALQLVENDRGHEGASRLLMRSFAAIGCRDLAFAEYESLRRWLLLHLAVQPSAATTALRDELQLGEYGARR